MWDGFLRANIQKARLVAAKHFGELGDGIDGAAVMFLDLYLWCVLFYGTDTRFGSSASMNWERRGELMISSVKEIGKRIKNRSLTNDELRDWAQFIGMFRAQFERQIESSGGISALCKPMFSHCLRAIMSAELFLKMLPTPQHVRAVDFAAAHGAVWLLNAGGKLTQFQVIDLPVDSFDFDAPDVFVSYGSEDREIALTFADQLNLLRIETWIDRNLAPMGEFAREIDSRIAVSKVVLVLWSPRSVTSRWVQAEALHAFNKGNMIAIMLEPCALPVPFNAVQTIHWPRGTSEQRFENWADLMRMMARPLARPGLDEYIQTQQDAAKLADWKKRHPNDPLSI